MTIRHSTRSLSAAIFTTALCVATAASAQTKLDMTAFGGASNLPVWIAQDRGLFAKEGLEIKLDRTTGSTPQMDDIMAGKYPIATTSIDNVVAFHEGQGAKSFDKYDVIGVGGVHSGLNTVIARPEIKTYADIKGKTIAVDSANSGYAFVLYKILANKGLKFGQDYQLVSVGGGPERLAAMKENKAVAAIVSAPNDTDAKNMGYTILDDAAAALGGYQGSAYVVRRDWAKAHEKEVVSWLKAIIAAHDYVYANKADSIKILQARIKDLSDADAEIIYASLTTGAGGLNKRADINMAGMKAVLDLRAEYGTPKKTLSDPGKYVDMSYHKKALAGM